MSTEAGAQAAGARVDEDQAAIDAAIAARAQLLQASFREEADAVNQRSSSMSALGYAAAPNFYNYEGQPDVPPPSVDYLESINAGAMGGAAGSGARGGVQTFSTALPDCEWQENARCSYGAVRSICMGAWCVFLTIPTIYFLLVLPPLQARIDLDITTFFLVLFGLTAVCFFLTGCINPGVPPAPKPMPEEQGFPQGTLPHPGEGYTLSRDTRRYVQGFDHFCEFVGNDIGKGNLGYFISFLVLLSTLCFFVVGTSVWQQILMWMPPSPSYHLLLAPWRVVLVAAIAFLILWSLHKCWTSDACAGVGPLIMLMPGAQVGAVLVVAVIILTIVLPLMSDMWGQVGPESNPTAFFLVLPCLAFAVLFCGMSMHWVHLIWDGISQKIWLKSKGYKRQRKPTDASGVALV